ncbi:hypothetical protein [Bacteroides finegoldii]|jgi:hypothetical protein|uniref:hypothetical protein n=1 Tax=Bacteroides finegoldii TaxID=338188 RepID=UPI00321A36F8
MPVVLQLLRQKNEFTLFFWVQGEHNHFFNLNYYAGLEDDADMGIRMITSFRIYDNIKKNICLATLYKQKDCFT